MSAEHDGLLHVWQCQWCLPSGKPCGYIHGGPGTCPYDHGEDAQLVELVAVNPEQGVSEAMVSQALDAAGRGLGYMGTVRMRAALEAVWPATPTAWQEGR